MQNLGQMSGPKNSFFVFVCLFVFLCNSSPTLICAYKYSPNRSIPVSKTQNLSASKGGTTPPTSLVRAIPKLELTSQQIISLLIPQCRRQICAPERKNGSFSRKWNKKCTFHKVHAYQFVLKSTRFFYNNHWFTVTINI